MQFTIRQGMNQDILKDYPDNHFDAIVTDPPYGIEFLGKDWDKNTGAMETWQECYRVLKPGGHLLAFSAARTYHHLATNIESAGFEIRDQIMWLYASGFPKAQDIGKAIDKRAGKQDHNYGTTNNNGSAGGLNMSFTEQGAIGSRRCNKCKKDVAAQYGCEEQDCGLKYKPQTDLGQQWAGWKTALKPAHEPIVMARKPMKGSTVDNVLKHGVGALNIDATRVGDEEITSWQCKTANSYTVNENNTRVDKGLDKCVTTNNQGRFPSNVIGEIPDYQKYFYCPKVSRAERHCGFEQKNIPAPFGDVQGCYQDGKRFAQVHQDLQKGSLDHIPYVENRNGNVGGGKAQVERVSVGNNHPTVKPVELMKYLIKLVTPAGGRVLDPFNGSGSTGMAAVELGYEYVGCELDPNYVAIAERRIQGWYERTRPDTNFNELFE